MAGGKTLFFVIFVLGISRCCYTIAPENRIINDILHTRKNSLGISELIGKPTKEATPMTIEFALGLVQITDIIEEEQSIVFQTWEYLRWVDEYMSWDPKDYDGLERIFMPIALLWQPDLILYHVIEVVEDKAVPDLATVYYDGTIYEVRERTYKVSCDIDVRRFPYDTHHCNLTYGLWIHTMEEMNLVFYTESDRGIFLDQFKESLKWNLSSLSVDVRYKNFSCCPGTMVFFDYLLDVSRQATFLTFVLIIPAVLLAILNILMYLLPGDSTAKVDIGLGIFLSYFLLLVILVESAPPIGSYTPMLGNYFTISLILSAGTMFTVTLTNHLREKKNTREPFPRWAKRLLMLLGCMVTVDRKISQAVANNYDNQVRNNVSSFPEETKGSGSKHACDNVKNILVGQNSVDPEENKNTEDESPKDRSCVLSSQEGWVLLAKYLNCLFLALYLIIYLILTTIVFCVV